MPQADLLGSLYKSHVIQLDPIIDRRSKSKPIRTVLSKSWQMAIWTALSGAQFILPFLAMRLGLYAMKLAVFIAKESFRWPKKLHYVIMRRLDQTSAVMMKMVIIHNKCAWNCRPLYTSLWKLLTYYAIITVSWI